MGTINSTLNEIFVLYSCHSYNEDSVYDILMFSSGPGPWTKTEKERVMLKNKNAEPLRTFFEIPLNKWPDFILSITTSNEADSILRPSLMHHTINEKPVVPHKDHVATTLSSILNLCVKAYISHRY